MKLKYILLVALLFPFCLMAQRDYKKGYKLYKENKFSDAIPFLQKAVAEDKSNDDAIYYLATCFRQVNNYVDAEKNYAMLVSNSEMAQASDHYYYGVVLKNNGKLQEALTQFQKYSSLKPNDFAGRKMVESCKFAISIQQKNPNWKAELLTNVNSGKDDFGTIRYNNGVIFASSREGTSGTGDSKRSGQPSSDLFYVDRYQDKQLGVPKPFSNLINTKAEEAAAAFDPTNKILYFTRTVTVRTNPDLNNEGICKNKIYMTRLDNGVWSKPEELPFNSNKYNVAHPTLTKDGKTMYFCSDKPGGMGGKDIYVTNYDGTDWSEPSNVGDSVNTSGDEMFPVLHEDGTLYFSSNFHPGLGGLDLFMAQMQDKKFKRITNLGKAINSHADDFGIMFTDRNKKSGYISSNRVNGNGHDDVYFVSEIEPIKPQLPKKPSYSVINGRVFEKIMTLDYDRWNITRGTIVDNASVALTKNQQESQRQVSNYEGRFTFQVDSSEFQSNNYGLVTTKPGYLKNNLNVNRTDVITNREIVVELERVIISDILYRFDRYFLTDSAKTKINLIRQLMLDHPEMKLQFSSHACPMGTDQYNYVLSQRRANSVLEYLTKNPDASKNIDASRISFDWFGETKFLTDKNGKIEYFKSRRTEFKALNPDDSFETRTESEGYIVVKKGETLQSIAKNYNTTVEQLQRLNSIKGLTVSEGQKLKVR